MAKGYPPGIAYSNAVRLYCTVVVTANLVCFGYCKVRYLHYNLLKFYFGAAFSSF